MKLIQKLNLVLKLINFSVSTIQSSIMPEIYLKEKTVNAIIASEEKYLD